VSCLMGPGWGLWRMPTTRTECVLKTTGAQREPPDPAFSWTRVAPTGKAGEPGEGSEFFGLARAGEAGGGGAAGAAPAAEQAMRALPPPVSAHAGVEPREALPPLERTRGAVSRPVVVPEGELAREMILSLQVRS
jgi:hypothetical protein